MQLQSLAERQQSNQRLLKIKAERRVGSLGRMRQWPKRVLAGFLGASKKPARTFAHSSEAISIRWRPIFPSGPSPETSKDFSITLVTTKIDRESYALACCAGIVEVRSSAINIYFERTLRRCARCCKTSDACAPLATTQLDIGLAAARARAQEACRSHARQARSSRVHAKQLTRPPPQA